MALFKVFKGNSANLPTEMHDGYCYFTTDDGQFYIDYLDADGVTLRRRPISGPGKSIEYIVGTQTAKTGSWTGVTKDSSLAVGKTIAYKLPYAGNGNATLTLTFTNPIDATVSKTSAIPVYTNTSRVTTHYGAGAVILLTYDGTYWRATDYWNSNSRDPGYGKITPGAVSTATAAITKNTTQIAAGTYSENLNINPGNKWIEMGATSGASNGEDTLTLGHALSGVTAGTSFPNAAQTPAFDATFNIPTITVDAAGHVTEMSTTTVKIPAQTQLSGGSAAANDTTVVGGVTVSNHAVTVAKKTLTAGTGISLTGATDKVTINHSHSIAAKTAAAQAAKTLTWGGTFTIYEEKYDAQGHVTGVASYNMTMPSNPNTDYRVRQTNDASTNANYRLLLSNSANDTQEDQISRKNANLIYNPSTNKLSTGNLKLTGELDVTGNAYLRNTTSIDSLTAGSLLVNGNTNFIQIPTAPTAAEGTNDTSLATTAFVKNSIASLSTAMHFIGKATVAITDGSATNPSISGYDFTADRKPGDVIIDKDNAYEYVWTYEGKWERLGPDGSYKVTQSAVDSGAAATNKWVSRIQQNANGVITATMGTLDTSGTWSGTAAKATKDSDGNAINTTYIKKSVLSGAFDIMYSSAASTPARLAANTTTTKKFLRMTGTGSAGAAPVWDTVTKTDVGLGNVTNHQQVHEVAWDSTNKKITRSKNGTAGDVVQFEAGENVTLTAAAGKLTIAAKDTVYVLPTATTTKKGGIIVGENLKINNDILSIPVEDKSPTLAWNTTSTIAKIGDTEIKVKLPANPNTNTDILVKQTAKTDSAEYKILTTASASPTSGSAAEAAYGTIFTINPSEKTITSPNYKVTSNATITYNTTNGCLEIIV